jgi:hypothetical protein
MENKTQTKETSQRMSFNEWTAHTKFGTLWAPDLEEVLFYQDHELRKEVYRDVKHLPKINFEERPALEVMAEYIAKVLRITK